MIHNCAGGLKRRYIALGLYGTGWGVCSTPSPKAELKLLSLVGELSKVELIIRRESFLVFMNLITLAENWKKTIPETR